VEADFWLERWQRGETGFHQSEVNVDLQLHWPGLQLARDQSVFVPLCGRTRDMCWLRALGHPVIGIELSELAVQGFFRELGLTPEQTRQGPLQRWQAGGFTLYCGDFFAIGPELLAACTAVYDRAALIALPAPMRPRYVQHLLAVLPPATTTLLLTMDYPQQQMQGPPFSVDETEVRRLFETQHSVTLLATRDTLANEPRLRQRGLSACRSRPGGWGGDPPSRSLP
jgi:thiopurine S-methyltransferase